MRFFCLIKGASKAIANFAHIDPMKVIYSYKKEIIQQAHAHILGEDMPILQLSITLEDGDSLRIISPAMSTVANLLEAEKFTLGWGDTVRMKEGNLLIPGHFGLSEALQAPVVLEHRSKRQRTGTPCGVIVVGIVHGGELRLEFLDAGDFMFQALRKLGLQEINWLIDDEGNIIGSDFRVWTSIRVYTMDAFSFPTLTPLLRSTEMRANGSLADIQKGLSDGMVSTAMESLIRSAFPPEVALPMLLEPWWTAEGDSHFEARYKLQQEWNFSNGEIFWPIVHDHHWFLLYGVKGAHGISWTSFDGLRGTLPRLIWHGLRQVTRFLEEDFGTLAVQMRVHQPDDFSCGTVLLAHTCLCLGLAAGFDCGDISQLHAWLRSRDDDGLPSATGPGKDDLAKELAGILSTKGVPHENAHDRAIAAIQALGIQTISTALRSRNPWQMLKAEASKPSKMFKFVTQEELGNFIAQRAQEKYGTSNRPRKEKGKKPRPLNPVDIAVDPAVVTLLDGYFEDAMGNAVNQIQIADVIPDATGLAICNESQAMPYFDNKSNLSCEPLALLVIGECQTSDWGMAFSSSTQFPALCSVTKEPMILCGHIVQLGDVDVQRVQPKGAMHDEDTLATVILKLTAFKDELAEDWADFAKAPIRAAIQKVPKLQLCKASSCDQCPFFHAPLEEECTSVIHEVWARRFQAGNNAGVPVEKATQFQAFLRISKSAMEEVLSVNSNGLYLEPRAEGHRGGDPNFSVIWIQENTRADALHKLRMTPGAVSLARFKQRYGLRVPTAQEEKVHRALKPDVDYVKLQIVQTWKIHPLPFGLQRGAIQKLLTAWSWKARALQPIRGSASGAAWEVGSADPPPATVQQAYNQDVIITLLKDKSQPSEERVQVLPKKTLQFFRDTGHADPAPRPKADPWQLTQNDPWASWTRKHPPATVAEPVQQRIDVVKKQLQTDVHGLLQKELDGATHGVLHAKNEATERRFQSLEGDMQELKAHNQKLTTWFQEAGTKLNSQEQQMQVLATAIEAQQNDLGLVRAELKQSHESLQSNMHGALGHMKQELTSELGTTMQAQLEKFSGNIEAMLAKKTRTE